MWWRVELDKLGAILNCVQVSEPDKGSRLLAFVQGDTKEQACSNVKDWYRKFRAQQLASKQRRDARRKAAGLCTYCGHLPARPGRKTCLGCSKKKYQMERAWHERGCVPKYAPADPVQVRERYMALHGLSVHAPTVLRQFDELGPMAFRRWLVTLIEDRRARAQSEAPAEAAE